MAAERDVRKRDALSGGAHFRCETFGKVSETLTFSNALVRDGKLTRLWLAIAERI